MFPCTNLQRRANHGHIIQCHTLTEHICSYATDKNARCSCKDREIQSPSPHQDIQQHAGWRTCDQTDLFGPGGPVAAHLKAVAWQSRRQTGPGSCKETSLVNGFTHLCQIAEFNYPTSHNAVVCIPTNLMLW